MKKGTPVFAEVPFIHQVRIQTLCLSFTDDEETLFNQRVDEINRADLAWVIHIGDIGWYSCSDSLFLARFQLYQQIRHPFVYTPTRCFRPPPGVQRGGASILS